MEDAREDFPARLFHRELATKLESQRYKVYFPTFSLGVHITPFLHYDVKPDLHSIPSPLYIR
jgi:hypothetical protein